MAARSQHKVNIYYYCVLYYLKPLYYHPEHSKHQVRLFPYQTDSSIQGWKGILSGLNIFIYQVNVRGGRFHPVFSEELPNKSTRIKAVLKLIGLFVDYSRYLQFYQFSQSFPFLLKDRNVARSEKNNYSNSASFGLLTLRKLNSSCMCCLNTG